MGKHGSNSKIKMRNVKFTLLILLTVLIFHGCSKEEEKPAIDLTLLTDEYLGEPFPFESAEVFLDGLVTEKYSIQNIAFSRDGNEFYFTRTTLDNDSSTIFVSLLKDEYWTSPKPVSFSTQYNETDPFITYDNQKMFFVSDRPIPSSEEFYFDYNIWYAERIGDTWGEPVYISEINSEEDEYSPTISENGTIYFSSARNDSEGYWDIYQAEFIDGKFVTPRKSLYPINTHYRDWDPQISQDEMKMLFVSDRPGGFGGGDIYLSTKDDDGLWGEPINLSNKINTNDYEYFPRISNDSNFLFFTRLLTNKENYYQDKALDTRDPFEYIYLPEAGRAVVYWVIADSLINVKF